MSGLNEKGKQVRLKAEGYFARALQHEIDHLDGILMLDRSLGGGNPRGAGRCREEG